MSTAPPLQRPRGRGGDAGAEPPARPMLHRTALRVAVAAALVAVAAALALPLAPVDVVQPEVSWPLDPARPSSTALQLSTYRPLAIDVSLGCRALRAAGATPDGLALATMAPGAADLDRLALVVRVRGDVAAVSSRGTPIAVVAVGPDDCVLRVAARPDGLTVSRDDAIVGRAPAAALPDVDALVTSIPALPGATAADLGVRVRPDDRFDTSPTPLKTAVLVVLLVAVGVAIGALALSGASEGVGAAALSRALARSRAWIGRRRPRVIDAVVPAVLVLWLFLAPMGDDDGYYSAMAKNVGFAGYVGNYYQLYTQSFTPFTWIYYALSWWQDAVGAAPVLLRLPALALGLLTWAAARSFVSRAGLSEQTGRWGRFTLDAVLGLAFLTWWLPYGMGDRPEPVVAASAMVTAVLVVEGVARRRAWLLAVATGVAAFGMTAAPTGFVALAPLLAGAPPIWRMLRATASVRGTLARLVVVVAPGTLGSALAFADGSLRDFLRAQEIFLGIQDQESWYTEIVRWGFLLNDIPMGSYARRAAVLVAVVALAWFLVLVGAGRVRGLPVPPRLAFAGWATLWSFGLLWLTPSKWTHHFGSMSGVGAVFLALLLVAGPGLARRLTDGRPPVAPVAAAALVLGVVLALAGHGPNSWAYSWLLGMPHPETPPQVWIFAFDDPAWWLLGLGLVTLVTWRVLRRRAASWSASAGVVALPVTVVVFFAVVLTYLLGSLGLATVRTWDTFSPWASDLRDPTASRCVAAQQAQVLDPASARPLPIVDAAAGRAPDTSLSAVPAFLPGGFFPGSPPPATLPADVGVVGSFHVPPGARTGDEAAGTTTTAWFGLPAPAPGTDVSVSVSGRADDDVVLRAEYARRTPGGIVPLGDRVLGSRPDRAVDSTAWRTVPLTRDEAPPAGADMVRLVAQDQETGPGGWLAFSAPTVQRWVPMTSVLPARAVAVGWQFAYLFPCQRQPVQANGINEPVASSVTWGDETLSGLDDAVWQAGRGGLFTQSLRSSEPVALAARLQDFPDVRDIQVYLLRQDLPTAAYTLTRTEHEVGGATVAPTWVTR